MTVHPQQVPPGYGPPYGPHYGPQYGPPYPPPPAARRRRRWPWVLLTVVVLVFGLVVAADRIAAHVAEDKAAEALQSSQQLSSRPDVSVAGFPFLTQLAAGQFDEITVTAANVRLESGITLDDVTVRLNSVSVPSDFSTVHADTASADALLGFGTVSRALGATVVGSDAGRLVLRVPVSFAGQRLTVRVSAAVATSARGIVFRDVAVGGVRLPNEVTRRVSGVFDTAISLAGMPFGVRLDGVSVTSDGVDVRLTGRDLSYSR